MTKRECFDDELEALGLALQRLPTPRPPDALVSRVRRLAHLELDVRSGEKLDRPVIVFLLLFSWTVSLLALLVVQLLRVARFELVGNPTAWTLSWSVVYFAYAWILGAAVQVLLGVYVRKERRLA